MHLVAISKLLGISIVTALMAPLIVAVGAFDPRRSYRLVQAWGWILRTLCGVRIRVRRLSPLDPNTPYVFMSNHRSHFDVLAVIAALPEFQLRWVAKRELLRVPVFGWALGRLGHIIIDRSNHRAAMASLRAAEDIMRRGVSVILFPEGTRAGSAEAVLALKRGGFVLASETGVPIVPLAVRGSLKILPRGARAVRAGTIDVEVGAPIATRGADVGALMTEVRGWLETHACEPSPAPARPARRAAEAR